MPKEPRVAFCVYDTAHKEQAELFKKTLRHFHDEKELPLVEITGETMELIKRYEDADFFYRATPTVALDLIDKYETVIKFDVDQLILGKLDYIFDSDYEAGVVLNFNQVDAVRYGYISFQGITAQEYFNNGLVAMRSKAFVKHWYDLCYSPYFSRLQYREQDLLNVLAHYGTYKARCFDHYDRARDYAAWHGLISKGYGIDMIVRDGEVILPQNKVSKMPNRDVKIKAYHWAGGSGEVKMDYHKRFSEEVVEYINGIVL